MLNYTNQNESPVIIVWRHFNRKLQERFSFPLLLLILHRQIMLMPRRSGGEGGSCFDYDDDGKKLIKCLLKRWRSVIKPINLTLTNHLLQLPEQLGCLHFWSFTGLCCGAAFNRQSSQSSWSGGDADECCSTLAMQIWYLSSGKQQAAAAGNTTLKVFVSASTSLSFSNSLSNCIHTVRVVCYLPGLPGC